jgi:hypothetical protein
VEHVLAAGAGGDPLSLRLDATTVLRTECHPSRIHQHSEATLLFAVSSQPSACLGAPLAASTPLTHGLCVCVCVCVCVYGGAL